MKCDYCDTNLNRHAFCSNAHKMQFWRNSPTPVTKRNTVTPSNKVMLPVSNTVSGIIGITKEEVVATLEKKLKKDGRRLCEHGAARGLCKKGCR